MTSKGQKFAKYNNSLIQEIVEKLMKAEWCRKDNNGNCSYDLDNFNEKRSSVIDKQSLPIVAEKSANGTSLSNNISDSNKMSNRAKN